MRSTSNRYRYDILSVHILSLRFEPILLGVVRGLVAVYSLLGLAVYGLLILSQAMSREYAGDSLVVHKSRVQGVSVPGVFSVMTVSETFPSTQCSL